MQLHSIQASQRQTEALHPRQPVRQWALSVPKRLRYFMQRDGPVLDMLLRIFLRVIAQTLQAHCAGAAHVDKVRLQIGAVAYIHRFGSSPIEHTHFHVCVVDGVFDEVGAIHASRLPFNIRDQTPRAPHGQRCAGSPSIDARCRRTSLRHMEHRCAR